MSTRSAAMKLARESIVIAVAGVVCGLLANWVSPRGLALGRDYFGPLSPPAAGSRGSKSPAAPAAAPSAVQDASPAGKRSKRGFTLASHDQVAALFRDPGRAEQRIVFIDARDDAHYAAGHIPGACQLDHYRLDRYIADVLGASQLAERIVVYCNGGNCEDSELASQDLVALGVPESKLLIYAGGITEWKQHGMPVETGARGIGKSPTP